MLHRLKQVVGLEFLDFDIRVAHNTEEMRRDDFHAREKRLQVGHDQLVEPDEIVMKGDRAILADGSGAAFYGHKAGQRIWHLQAGKFFIPLLVADDDGQVEAQV